MNTPGGGKPPSRYNSPFGPPPTNPPPLPAIPTVDRQRAFMENWMEPSLPAQMPSITDAGRERQGVVANMAALGTLPSAKLLKAVSRPDKDNGRATIGRESGPSSVSTPRESMATPEPSTELNYDPTRRQSFSVSRQPSVAGTEEIEYSSHPASTAATPAPLVITTANNPTENIISSYATSAGAPVAHMASFPTMVATQSSTPPIPSAPTPSAPAAPHTPLLQTSPISFAQLGFQPRTSFGPDFRAVVPGHIQTNADQKPGQHVFAASQGATPIAVNRPYVSPVVNPTPPQFGPNGEYYPDMAKTEKVVELAVNFALDEHRLPTAYAIRTTFDQQKTNKRMMRLFDAIYNAANDDDQMREFILVMKHKKKEGKKNNTAYDYFFGDGSDITPRHARYAPQSGPFFHKGSSVRTPSVTDASPMSIDQGRRSSINLPPASGTSPEADYHVHKKPRGNNFEPSALAMNGEAAADDSVRPHPNSVEASGTADATGGGERSQSQSRSRSNSTSSSLSSVDDKILQSGQLSQHASPEKHKSKTRRARLGHDAAAHTHSQGDSRFAHAAHANTNNANARTSLGAEPKTHPSLSNQNQPISAGLEPGPKTFTFSTTVTTSPAPAISSSSTNPAKPTKQSKGSQRQQSASTSNAVMPSATILQSTLPIKSGPVTKGALLKKQKADSNKPPGRLPYDENDKIQRMKRDVRARGRENLGAPVESYERDPLPLLPEFESNSDGGESVPALAPSKGPTKLRFTSSKRTRQSQAINDDHSDALSSPTLLPFQNDLAPGSVSVSRAGTPSLIARPARKLKTGTGLRVKTSPMKRKGGTAGIPRPSGERGSPTGNGFVNDQDNDDYCSSCGGNGELVCCDGCTRSFHYICADPPMDKDQSLPDEWYCNVCNFKDSNKNSERYFRGDKPNVFDVLLSKVHRRNPQSFGLPKDVRDRFENVKTGADGEYEETNPPKPKGAKAGWDEPPDYFRLKDSKGKVILCHHCNLQAQAPDRAIVPCNFCPLSWHLDCINPPMAKEPTLGKPFKCPAHVDDLLAMLPESLAPAHRFRKIKNAPIITPAVSRGFRNNGQIEIEPELTDDEDDPGFAEKKEYGQTYKLPAESVKLDFISKVRSMYGHLPRPDRSPKRRKFSHPVPEHGPWEQRDLNDQQAALNLASLVQFSTPNIRDPQHLIQALLSQAPPNVVAMMAQGTPDGMTTNKQLTPADTQSLIAMKFFIDAQLRSIGELSELKDVVTESPSEIVQSKDSPMELDESQELITETAQSALMTTDVEDDERATLAPEVVGKPVGEAPIEDTLTPIDDSPNEIEGSVKAIEDSKIDEETLKPAEWVATPFEDTANSVEDTTKLSEQSIESTESSEQVPNTAPVETPDSVGLKTPETTNFDTLEVDKNVLSKEVVDAADINQDLEMTN